MSTCMRPFCASSGRSSVNCRRDKAPRSTLCRAGGDAAAGSSPEYAFSRRSQLAAQLACLTPLLMDPPSAARAESTAEATVTDRVFLDFGLCPEGVRSDRKLGDKSILCSDPEPLGRLSIALFGNDAPGTVAQFKALVTSGALQGSSISKILPGRLHHQRPGTLSLNLSENEDEDYLRQLPGYRNLSFFITLGPGQVALDDENIVFGQVVDGLEVVDRIAAVPTFFPNDNLQAFNSLAKFIGDDRAQKTRNTWGRPLKAVVITDSGLLL